MNPSSDSPNRRAGTTTPESTPQATGQSWNSSFSAANSQYFDGTLYYAGHDVLVRLILERPGGVMNHIDPVALIQWTVVDQVRHIFGYRSYRYDRRSRGARIVAGSFSIPYRKSGLVRKKLYGAGIPSGDVDERMTLNLVREESLLLNQEPLQSWQQIMGAKANPARFVSVDPSPSSVNPNDVRAWPFPEDFSLYIYFRHQDQDEKVSAERSYHISGVTVTNMETQADTSGQPVMETYQFIGRDVDYADSIQVNETEELW